MQNSKLAIALASVSVLGLAASHAANAAIATATSGNSDLIFVAVDTTTGESYYDNLGTLAIPGIPPASTTFSDAQYTEFLSEVKQDPISYAVVGGSLGTTTTPFSIDSTVGGTAAPTSPSNSKLKQAPALLDQNVINPLNGLNGTSQNTGNGYLVSSASTISTVPMYTDASGLTTFNGKTSFLTTSAAGTDQSFYTFTTTGGSLLSLGSQVLDGTFTYSGNTLTYSAAGGVVTPPPPVPLPPAVWLLGSGLLGLLGISRRRAV